MEVIAHEPSGFEGCLVHVEVDIRRGLPGVDLVGLAAGAVKEARERVRAAIRNSGFEFPLDRVLINLAPADLPKAGSAYDLPIALAVLGASGSLPDPGRSVLALGELRLDGSVRPARGVLPAVAAALGSGIDSFIVPRKTRPKPGPSAGAGSILSLASTRPASSSAWLAKAPRSPPLPRAPEPRSPEPRSRRRRGTSANSGARVG
jgi:magnesium chelatase family protein